MAALAVPDQSVRKRGELLARVQKGRNGFSHAELAELLNLKEVAVRQRLARARKAFKRLYAYESGEVLEKSTSIAERRKRVQASSLRSRVPARRVPWSAGPARVLA